MTSTLNFQLGKSRTTNLFWNVCTDDNPHQTKIQMTHLWNSQQPSTGNNWWHKLTEYDHHQRDWNKNSSDFVNFKGNTGEHYEATIIPPTAVPSFFRIRCGYWKLPWKPHSSQLALGTIETRHIHTHELLKYTSSCSLPAFSTIAFPRLLDQWNSLSVGFLLFRNPFFGLRRFAFQKAYPTGLFLMAKLERKISVLHKMISIRMGLRHIL